MNGATIVKSYALTDEGINAFVQELDVALDLLQPILFINY